MESVYIGTELKFLITIEADNFDMATNDFTVEIVRGPNHQFFTKADLVDEVYTEDEQEMHHYYVCFDTASLGYGDVYAVVTAYVPDMDFDDGLRTEVYVVALGKLMAVPNSAVRIAFGDYSNGR